MKKTVIITIMVDDVDLALLEGIQDELDDIFEGFGDKRITMQIQDEPIVRRG